MTKNNMINRRSGLAKPASWAFAALIALAFGTANAASLYKWIDADGNVVYQDTPPPGNVNFEESQVDGVAPELPEDTGRQIEEAALENPVSLYSVPQCDSCDLVRLYLERNSIPFAEKNARNNQDTQAELQELTGTLSVPTLVIGGKVLDGFSRLAIKGALEDAGFPIKEEQETAEEENTEEAPTVEGTETPVAEITSDDSDTDSSNTQ